MLNLFGNEEQNGLIQIHQIAQAINIYKFVYANMPGEFWIHYNLIGSWPDSSFSDENRYSGFGNPHLCNQDLAQRTTFCNSSGS